MKHSAIIGAGIVMKPTSTEQTKMPIFMLKVYDRAQSFFIALMHSRVLRNQSVSIG